MLILIEVGLILMSVKGKWFNERVKVYKYWLEKSSWQIWWKKRKYIQSIRQVSDRELTKDAVSEILFQEKEMENSLVLYVANPLMAVYWWVIRFIIYW